MNTHAVRMFFSNRSVKQRQDILTNKLAANTHVIARKTQIAQCAAAGVDLKQNFL